MIQLHAPASRPQTFKMQLSQHLWQLGSGVFFSENLPFSGRNNPEFSRRLVDLFVQRVQILEREGASFDTYDVLELGAGLGFLSVHFLRDLSDRYPAIFTKVRLLVTDGSADLLKQIKTFLPASVKSKVRLMQLDMCAFSVPSGFAPIFVWGAYVLDSWPCRHICVDSSGNVSEILVQTQIDDKAMMFDSTAIPPRNLAVRDWWNVVDSLDRDALFLAMRGMDSLVETSHHVSLADLSYWTEEEKRDIHAFLSWYGPVKDRVFFNYPVGLISFLNALGQAMVPGGICVLTDFGYASTLRISNSERLLKLYGAACFYSVCFPYVSFLCECLGYGFVCSDREKDSTQELVVTMPHSSQSSFYTPLDNAVVQAFFDDNRTRAVADILDQLNQMGSGYSLTEFESKFSGLSGVQQSDYFFLKSVGIHLLADGFFEEALSYGVQLISVYGELAYDGWLLQGWVYQKQERFDKAIDCFKQALRVYDYSSVAWGALASCYLLSAQLESAHSAMMQALRFSRSPDFGMQLIAFIGVCYRLGLHDDVERVIDWMMDSGALYPQYLDEGVMQTVYRLRDKL